MFSRNSLRAFQAAVLVTLLFAAVTDAQAQFDKIRKRIPGMGGSSEVDTILGQIDGVRVKSAYARITLSLADDIIRRQALRNSTKKSTQAQIEKIRKRSRRWIVPSSRNANCWRNWDAKPAAANTTKKPINR